MRSTPHTFRLRNYFAILVLLLAAAWLIRFGIRSLHPLIESVPAVFADEAVTVRGKGFGSRAGSCCEQQRRGRRSQRM